MKCELCGSPPDVELTYAARPLSLVGAELTLKIEAALPTYWCAECLERMGLIAAREAERLAKSGGAS